MCADLALPEDVLGPTPADPHAGRPCRLGIRVRHQRYAMLGKVIEAVRRRELRGGPASARPRRAGMQVFPSPALGAHAGLVSTTRHGRLPRGPRPRRAAEPGFAAPACSPRPARATGASLPVSLGWFTQAVQGEARRRSFGQDDPDHSGALLVPGPRRDACRSSCSPMPTCSASCSACSWATSSTALRD